jgi:hypothetical protein
MSRPIAQVRHLEFWILDLFEEAATKHAYEVRGLVKEPIPVRAGYYVMDKELIESPGYYNRFTQVHYSQEINGKRYFMACFHPDKFKKVEKENGEVRVA